MTVWLDSEGRIKDVGGSSDASLTPWYIADEDNPFDGWPTAKICCYKVTISDNGHVTMMTPYVPSSELGYIEVIGKQLDELKAKHDLNAANIDYMAMEMDIDLEV